MTMPPESPQKPRGRPRKAAATDETSAQVVYRAPALDKGLDILELLATQPQGLTRAQIVKDMARSPNEIYRMLERLVARQYVTRSASGDRYALSLKLFAMAHAHPPLNRLVNQALPVMDDFARRAADNKLKLDELQGGTFTISNGGVYGSMMSTPIINPPQSGILGLHAIQDRPMAVNGQVVIRPMMYLALTYDHRLVDGREAVTFLKRIKDTIEDPSRLMLEV